MTSPLTAPLETAADWSVLADYLIERGDARGEWLQLDLHADALPDHDHERERLHARVADQQRVLERAPLQELERALGRRGLAWLEGGWRCGLLTRALLRPGLDADPDRVVATLRALLDADASLALGELQLEVAPTLVARALAAGPAHPLVHTLVLGDFHEPVGELATIVERLPKLRALELRGPGITLRGLERAPLQRLELHCEGEFMPAMRDLEAARFEVLETLGIRFGGRRYAQADDPLALLDPLWIGRATPALRHLGLRAIEFADALIPALAAAPLLARLRTLALCDAWLTDAGAASLLDHAAAFEGLERIDLTACHLTEPRAELLRRRFGARVELGSQVLELSWAPGRGEFEWA